MGKDGAAAAAGAVRGRSSECCGRCSVPERAVSAQGRASGRGQGSSVPLVARLVAAQGNAEAAGGGGDASVLHATRRTVMARWVTGLESSQHPTLANDVGAGRLRKGRRAVVVGQGGPGWGPGARRRRGALPDSCVRAHALLPNPRLTMPLHSMASEAEPLRNGW